MALRPLRTVAFRPPITWVLALSFFGFDKNYFLNFRLAPIRPIRPVPIKNKVAGSGTGAATSTKPALNSACNGNAQSSLRITSQNVRTLEPAPAPENEMVARVNASGWKLRSHNQECGGPHRLDRIKVKLSDKPARCQGTCSPMLI